MQICTHRNNIQKKLHEMKKKKIYRNRSLIFDNFEYEICRTIKKYKKTCKTGSLNIFELFFWKDKCIFIYLHIFISNPCSKRKISNRKDIQMDQDILLLLEWNLYNEFKSIKKQPNKAIK